MVKTRIIELLDLLKKDFELSEWTQKLTWEKANEEFLKEVEELKLALEKKDMENYSEEIGDVFWDLLKLMMVAEKNEILDMKKVLEDVREKINLRKPFLAEGKFVESDEEVRIWQEVKKRVKNERAGNNR